MPGVWPHMLIRICNFCLVVSGVSVPSLTQITCNPVGPRLAHGGTPGMCLPISIDSFRSGQNGIIMRLICRIQKVYRRNALYVNLLLRSSNVNPNEDIWERAVHHATIVPSNQFGSRKLRIFTFSIAGMISEEN